MNSYRKNPQKLLFGVLLFIIFIPNMLALIMAEDIQGVGAHIIYLLASVGEMLLMMTLFNARWYFVLSGISILLSLVEITHLILNKTTTSLLFVYTIMIAEPGESGELFGSFWPLVLVVLLLYVFYYIMVFKNVGKGYILTKQTRVVVACVVPLFLLTGFFLLSNERKQEGREKKAESESESIFFPIHDEFSSGSILSSIDKVFPINMAISIGQIIQLNKEIKVRQHDVNNYVFDIDSISDDEDALMLLVIGETARYGNFGINGYERNTTPRLNERSNLISYDSVFSVANLTTVVVPLLLSHSTPLSMQSYMEEKSIPEAFSEAGYYTAWLANQSFGNRFLMRISQTCDYAHYIPIDEESESNRDIYLLKYLSSVLSQEEKAQFVVMHTLGCHYRYDKRYPMDFSVYHPALEDNDAFSDLMRTISWKEIGQMKKNSALLDEFKVVLRNSYDNAILYTDYFLDSTIQMIADQHRPAVILYVADHGENLFDDERNMFLHASYGGSVYEYHVPLMVWYSDEYKQKYPEKVAALEANEYKKFTSMKVFDSMIDLANLRYPGFNASQSIANESMKSDSILWGVDANMNLMQISEHF